ncbi:hypothetical protein E2C01_042371 [Portunus trituberculatus]|uniref:Uncharacterized protein n=1 Tax=Portunus trituberculatus TaxID=210409 RepID=A0A5B7FUG7_PORTR|nr:hypothetical protein [Portunus trituberculatus]
MGCQGDKRVVEAEKTESISISPTRPSLSPRRTRSTATHRPDETAKRVKEEEEGGVQEDSSIVFRSILYPLELFFSWMCRVKVYGDQKINGQNLQYFDPPHEFLKLYKIAK